MKSSRERVIIIGAGASGLFLSSLLGHKCLILERNNTAGRKLLLTGGGRCNFTHIEATSELEKHYRGDKRLIRSLMRSAPPECVRSYMKRLGVDSVEDKEGRVYPSEGGAEAVLAALTYGANITYGEYVLGVIPHGSHYEILSSSGSLYSECVVFATGGTSYPETGSDGSAFSVIKKLGHTFTPITPSLAPLKLERPLSPSGATIYMRIKAGSARSEGNALITHQGLSGPVALNISWNLSPRCEIIISFTDDLSFLEKKTNALVKNAAPLPSALLRCILGPLAEKRVSSLSPKEIGSIRETLMAYRAIASPIAKGAMSSHGGIKTEEVNVNRLMSKIHKGIYFMGDLLDIDGDEGGYSLQQAFASAMVVYRAIKTIG